MDYIRTDENGQLVFEQSTEFLQIPSCLFGFHNTETIAGKAASGRNVYCFQGNLDLPESEHRCECGKRMHINSHPDITLRHLCFGSDLSCLRFPHIQLRCSGCGAVKEQYISFKAPGHMITEALYQYIRDLLALQTYTNKQVAEITGPGKNVVKEIDRKWLQEKSTPLTTRGSSSRNARQSSSGLMNSSSMTVIGTRHIFSIWKPIAFSGSPKERQNRS